MCSQLPGQHVLAPRHISIRDLCLLGRYEHLWPSIRYGGIAVVIGDIEGLVLPDRIELSTSPLPRECSTTELRQREATGRGGVCHRGGGGSTAAARRNGRAGAACRGGFRLPTISGKRSG